MPPHRQGPGFGDNLARHQAAWEEPNRILTLGKPAEIRIFTGKRRR
jgi:hypothetical protein